MMKSHKLSYYLLLPFSWIYGLGVAFRNFLFDNGILKSQTFSIPIICVGNLSVGGTGKTPFTEYLIRLLSKQYSVAVLSRGYKRKSKGFVLADENSTAQLIGDEPYQMKQKYPSIVVAVDANRPHGIEELLSSKVSSKIDIIILDDAFQHRYVKAGLNILLTSYNNCYTTDTLLPAGRLREHFYNAARAQMVVYTKCPKDITPTEIRAVIDKLSLFSYQDFFVTSVRYGTPYYFMNKSQYLKEYLKESTILLITGIAKPEPLKKYLETKTNSLESLTFPDHHSFSKADVSKVNATFDAFNKKGDVIVITTEKDAARLEQTKGLNKRVRESMLVQPIEMFFLRKEKLFNNKILSYVRKNSRDSSNIKKEI